MNKHPAGAGEFAQALDHPPRSRLGQMADLACALSPDSLPDHLVVGPERSIHQQAICACHLSPDFFTDFCQSRGVEETAPRVLISYR